LGTRPGLAVQIEKKKVVVKGARGKGQELGEKNDSNYQTSGVDWPSYSALHNMNESSKEPKETDLRHDHRRTHSTQNSYDQFRRISVVVNGVKFTTQPSSS